MVNRCCAFVLVCLVMLCVTLQVEARIWQDTTLRNYCTGDLIAYTPPLVTIRRYDNGACITVDESQLDKDSRIYLEKALPVLKAGYQDVSYEVDRVLSDGIVCIKISSDMPPTPGPLFIRGDFSGTLRAGQRHRSTLFVMGVHTIKTPSGKEQVIPCFTTDVDEAMRYLIRAAEAARRSQFASPPPVSAPAPSPAQPPPSPPLQPQPPPASPEDILLGSGTGFAVSDSGHIVTNAHVVAGAIKVAVYFGEELVLAKVLARDAQNDLALLKVEQRTTALSLGIKEKVRLGDEVSVGGYPNPEIQGSSVKLTRGVISGMKGIMDDVRHYQIDAAVQPGNSGGPLISQSGQVIGVVNERLDDAKVMRATGLLPQNVNYAIKISYVLPLIQSAGVESMVMDRPEGAEKKTIGELLEASTHRIVSELPAATGGPGGLGGEK